MKKLNKNQLDEILGGTCLSGASNLDVCTLQLVAADMGLTEFQAELESYAGQGYMTVDDAYGIAMQSGMTAQSFTFVLAEAAVVINPSRSCPLIDRRD